MKLFNKNKKDKESEFKKGDVVMDPQEVPSGEIVSEEILGESVSEIPEIAPAQPQVQTQPTTAQPKTKESIEA